MATDRKEAIELAKKAAEQEVQRQASVGSLIVHDGGANAASSREGQP